MYSGSYERNRDPIVEVLKGLQVEPGEVLEVGSGSGQHICYFAKTFGEEWSWQPTEQEQNVESIQAWREAEGVSARVKEPVAINLLEESWSDALEGSYTMVMSVNVVHIVAWQGVVNLLNGVGKMLKSGGVLYLYGPYRSQDRELEPSNARFDVFLKETYEGGGLRDVERVVEVARGAGLEFEQEIAMPANNRSLIFRKI